MIQIHAFLHQFINLVVRIKAGRVTFASYMPVSLKNCIKDMFEEGGQEDSSRVGVFD